IVRDLLSILLKDVGEVLCDRLIIATVLVHRHDDGAFTPRSQLMQVIQSRFHFVDLFRFLTALISETLMSSFRCPIPLNFSSCLFWLIVLGLSPLALVTSSA